MRNMSCSQHHQRLRITGIWIRHFDNFKQDIDDYFPSFVNVIGRGFYKDGNLQSFDIEVPIQFFGTSETIGFTQYLTGLIVKYFPNVYTEVSITSVNGPEALIVKEAGRRGTICSYLWLLTNSDIQVSTSSNFSS